MAAAASLQRVIKRDGFEEAYDPLKLRETLAAALEASGEEEALRDCFATTIEIRVARAAGRVTTSEGLAEEALRVLVEYGCPDAARAYRDYREEERELLGSLRIHGGERGRGSAMWDRARMQRSLLRDRHLERAVARMLARRVERRLSCLGFRHLTARLLAAMVDNEARVLGLPADPLHGDSLGFSRAELRAWLGSGTLPSPPGGLPASIPLAEEEGLDLRLAVGEELLMRFAVEEMMSPEQAEDIRLGRYEILALGDWARPLRRWLHPEAGEPEEGFWQRVSHALSSSHEVQVLWPGSRPWGRLSEQAPHWLSPAIGTLRLATSCPRLAQHWLADGFHVAMPTAAFFALDDALQASLSKAARLRLQWQPPGPLPSPASLRERRLETAAVVNLPCLAASVNSFDEEAFLAATRRRLHSLAQLLTVRLERAGGLTATERVCLLPAGLDWAIERLLPDPALRQSRGRRLLLALCSAFEQAARQAGFRLEHHFPPHPQAAGTRLAQADGLEQRAAYVVGWWPTSDLSQGLQMALDTAPWLEAAPASFAARLAAASARRVAPDERQEQALE